MTRTTQSPRAPAIALALALLLPLGSLPIFALGYWDKAEPLVVWFHASAALAALAVALSLWRQPQNLDRVVHPFVVLPLALGLWSAMVAPTTALPWLSLLGAPQSGYGALWFVDMAALVACALLVADYPHIWRKLAWLAIAVVAAVAAVKAWDWLSVRLGGGHLLIFVAAYYGWLALALPLVAQGSRQRGLAIGAALAVAVASQSLTAMALVVGGVSLAVLGPRVSKRSAVAAVTLAAALPWLLLHGLPWALEKDSLRDRVQIHGLIQAALAADPLGWLLGHGWGRTQDAFHTWLNLSGERLWDPSWIFLHSDYFHSHNWALETLHAAGLPGMLLALAGLVAIPWFARTECRKQALAFAIALALFNGLWFQLCLSIPLTAMALAALADRTSLWPRLPSRAVAALVVLLALVQAGASAALLANGLALGAARIAWNATPPQTMAVPRDFRDSDLAAAELIRDSLTSFAARAHSEPTAPLAAAILPMLDFMDRRADHTHTMLLLTTGLGAMAQIHVTGELAFAARPEQMVQWRRWLDRLLVLAPLRSDQAIPYLTTCIAAGRLDRVAEFSARLLATNADDPVGLYYQGLVAVTGGDRAGMILIRRAILHGLDRFMPMDPKLKTLFGLSSS